MGTRAGDEISNGVVTGNKDDGVPVVLGEPGDKACPWDVGRMTTGVEVGVPASLKSLGMFIEMSGTILRKPTAPINPAVKQQIQIHKKTINTMILAIQPFLDIDHPI